MLLRALLLWVLINFTGMDALAAPLTPYPSLSPGFRSQLTNSGTYVKGIGVETWYPLEVDPSTGALPVSGSFSVTPSLLLEDHGYGTVSGTTTLRTASQIGNATGAASFGYGTVSAQTLRTVSVLSNGSAGADFGAGTTSTTTLRTVLATDQSSIPVNNLAAVTTSAPTYTTGTQQPLSLTTAGGLRTDLSGTTVPLPTGAATSAKQPALGTAGTPSSDVISVQGVSGGTPQNIAASSLPLPTGASTLAAQTTGNTSLASIDSKVPTLGQKTMANSAPVVIASDQSTLNVQVGTVAGLANSPVLAAQVTGGGLLRVSEENTSIFYDPFDSALDTVNRWNAPSVSGTGASVTQGAGGETWTGGLAASSYAVLTSQPSFVGTVPGYLQVGYANKLEATPVTGAHRFWGIGTAPATPTLAAPLTDAVGWEMDTNGKLFAVVYSGGTRTQIADLSSSGTNKQPLDGAYHRYSMDVRTDRTFWYIDSRDVPVAISNFQFPTIQTLPLRISVVNGLSTLSTAATIISTGIGLGDSSRSSMQIADGTSPWRKLSIGANGAMSSAAAGKNKNVLATLDYSSTNVTNSAYVQLVASTALPTSKVYPFDSSGAVMILAVGGVGSEVDQLYIPPGGSGAGYELAIPAGSRISLKVASFASNPNSVSNGFFVLTGLN